VTDIRRSNSEATLVVPVSPDGLEWLTFLPHGYAWANFRSPVYDLNQRGVFLRFSPDRPLSYLETSGTGEMELDDDDPNVKTAFVFIREIHLAFSEGLGPRAMRDLPLARIEAAVNRPAVRHQVLMRSSGAQNVLFTPFDLERHRDWINARPEEGLRRPGLRVRIPEGRNRPDDFYRQVADLFTYLATISSRPATDLAEANGVPTTTVHGWVKEARRRGILPAGERTRRAAGGHQ
jgi:hypothetical protein